jgi:hypothetical protein
LASSPKNKKTEHDSEGIEFPGKKKGVQNKLLPSNKLKIKQHSQ